MTETVTILRNGEVIEVPADTVAILPAPITEAQVIAERERRLAQGFDYDFADERGVHRIGTTEDDMRGWDEVTKASQAALALGNPDKLLGIVTDTGPAQVTAFEWQQVLDFATDVRQPIFTASFALQVMDPIPADFADDSYWPTA